MRKRGVSRAELHWPAQAAKKIGNVQLSKLAHINLELNEAIDIEEDNARTQLSCFHYFMQQKHSLKKAVAILLTPLFVISKTVLFVSPHITFCLHFDQAENCF